MKFVCSKCGMKLIPCIVCEEPSLCGDSWCQEHMPEGGWK